ncbi:hypothetical protein ACFW93_30330 [Streptomyces canus]|uniref:hypothetical protein n=1 Tax=Streptomyces canus TaxID=58343 RepID=UPI00367CE1A1
MDAVFGADDVDELTYALGLLVRLHASMTLLPTDADYYAPDFLRAWGPFRAALQP